MEAGIQPNIVACRAKNPVTETVMEKIGMFSNVPMSRIFSMHDRDSVYSIPEDMRKASLDREILSMLSLHDRVDPVHEDEARVGWTDFSRKLAASRSRSIKLGIAGKYAALRDAYASIDKAVEHAGIHLNCRIDTEWIDTTGIETAADADATLDGVDAIIVPGGFGVRGVEGKIRCVEHARNRGIPFLGICLGFQVAVIEFARNALGLTDAGSTEFSPGCSHPMISELPDQKKLEGIMGGTMRLGAQDVILEPGSLVSFLHGNRTLVRERFRHRFEVEPEYIEQLDSGGLRFTGRHPEFPIMQVLELPLETHPFFIGAQYHPELTGRPLEPQPMFMGLIAAAIARLDPAFAATKIGTRWVRQRNGCTANA